ncbi:MAG: homoserine dehydrogenase [Pseudomonadota bacterium]
MAEKKGVGIAGLGAVGASLVRLLSAPSAQSSSALGPSVVDHLSVTGISARSKSKDRGFDESAFAWFDDPLALATAPSTDIFVELIGGADGPALDAVTAALNHGKHVVTANKAMLAKHGLTLAKRAEEKGVSLSFEAAVAGAIPIIRTLKTATGPCAVTSVTGILNGTCNYILSEMETTGLDFAQALAEAQAKGFAEADPALDVGGGDAAQKLKLLAALGFQCWPASFFADGVSDPRVEGIAGVSASHSQYATELGYRIRLLGMAHKAPGLDAPAALEVAPFLVPLDHGFAHTVGPENLVIVAADPLGTLSLSGPGAGGDPTASAVAADLAALTHAQSPFTFTVPATTLEIVEPLPSPGSTAIKAMLSPAPGHGEVFEAYHLHPTLANSGISVVAKSKDGLAVMTGPITRNSLDDVLAAMAAAGTPMTALRIADI